MIDKKWSRTNFVTTTGADQLLIGASSQRTGLIICQPSAGTIRVVPGNAIAAGQGFFLDTTLPSLMICSCEYGDLATKEWRLLASAAANTVTVVEIYGELPRG